MLRPNEVFGLMERSGMSESELPGWIVDTATVLTIITFPITFWLGYQARKIRGYFFNRVRIGEILPELSQDAAELFGALRDWEHDSGRMAKVVIYRIKGRLYNLRKKLESEELKSVSSLISKIENRRFYLLPSRIADITLDNAWDIAADYATILSQVSGDHNDSRWRNK